jgi:hypothetical protein
MLRPPLDVWTLPMHEKILSFCFDVLGVFQNQGLPVQMSCTAFYKAKKRDKCVLYACF